MKKKANDNFSHSIFDNGCTVRKDVHRFNTISQLIFLQFSHLPKRWKRKDRGCEVPDTGVSRSADHNVRIQKQKIKKGTFLNILPWHERDKKGYFECKHKNIKMVGILG